MLLPFGSREDLQDSMISFGEEKRQRLKIHGKEECRDEITCLVCVMLFPLCWTEHCSTRHSSQSEMSRQDTCFKAVPPWTVPPSRGWSHPALLTPQDEIWSEKSCEGRWFRSKLGHQYPFNTDLSAVQGLKMAFIAPETTELAEKEISSHLSLNTRSSLQTYCQQLWAKYTVCLCCDPRAPE